MVKIPKKKSSYKPKGTPYKGSAMIEKNSSTKPDFPKGGANGGARRNVRT